MTARICKIHKRVLTCASCAAARSARVVSEARREAARQNGPKGGRPRLATTKRPRRPRKVRPAAQPPE